MHDLYMASARQTTCVLRGQAHDMKRERIDGLRQVFLSCSQIHLGPSVQVLHL
jgi:hypothetical protein